MHFLACLPLFTQQAPMLDTVKDGSALGAQQQCPSPWAPTPSFSSWAAFHFLCEGH